MAGTATTYLEKAVLSHTLGYGALAMPTGVFIGLCAGTVPPSAATGGTEVTGGAYARQSVVFADTGQIGVAIAANTATIAYPAATAPWGTIGWFEIWDALTAGHRLYWGPLVDPTDGVTPITRQVLTGDIVRFTAGVIQVQAI